MALSERNELLPKFECGKVSAGGYMMRDIGERRYLVNMYCLKILSFDICTNNNSVYIYHTHIVICQSFLFRALLSFEQNSEEKKRKEWKQTIPFSSLLSATIVTYIMIDIESCLLGEPIHIF